MAAELAAEDGRAVGGAEEGRGPGGGLEDEGGPRHHPDETEAPEEPERGSVVVVGDAEVEVAEDVLVHEVEPEPAVDVAECGERDLPVEVDEAERSGSALCGIGEAGEDVPGGGDEEEGFEGGPGVELAETAGGALEAAGEEEVEDDDGDGEDYSDEALGEDVEGAGGGEEAAVETEAVVRVVFVRVWAESRYRGLSTALRFGRDDGVLGGSVEFFGEPEGVEGEGGEEADGCVGDEDAGEEEDAEAGEQDERGVEAGAGGCFGSVSAVEDAAGEGFEEEDEGEDGEGERDARGDGEGAGRGCAEELGEAHGCGHGPVKERCLLEVADAVGVEGDVVVAEEHLAGDFGVDAVGVVEE